jgi:hypothetical protein
VLMHGNQVPGRTALNPGRSAVQRLGPLGLGSGPTWSICQIHPRGDDDFDIWSTLPCYALKCSNLVPKSLKSNKH